MSEFYSPLDDFDTQPTKLLDDGFYLMKLRSVEVFKTQKGQVVINAAMTPLARVDEGLVLTQPNSSNSVRNQFWLFNFPKKNNQSVEYLGQIRSSITGKQLSNFLQIVTGFSFDELKENLATLGVPSTIPITVPDDDDPTIKYFQNTADLVQDWANYLSNFVQSENLVKCFVFTKNEPFRGRDGNMVETNMVSSVSYQKGTPTYQPLSELEKKALDKFLESGTNLEKDDFLGPDGKPIF